MPVVPTVAVRKRGLDALRTVLGTITGEGGVRRIAAGPGTAHVDLVVLQRRARAIAIAATTQEKGARAVSHRIDSIALHPVFGPLLLAAILFVVFQAVFAWAQPPMDAISAGFDWLGALVTRTLPPGFVRDLLAQGVIKGTGAVVVFLPQILILFTFILLLEATGYMVRAAFMMDRLMARVGLSGRAFIPLLSSFACAVPGIMATRTIDDPRIG